MKFLKYLAAVFLASMMVAGGRAAVSAADYDDSPNLYTFTRDEITEIVGDIITNYQEYFDLEELLERVGFTLDDFINILEFHANHELMTEWGSLNFGPNWLYLIGADLAFTLSAQDESAAVAQLNNFVLAASVAAILDQNQDDEFFALPVFGYLRMIFGDEYVIAAMLNNPDFEQALTAHPWEYARDLLNFNIFEHGAKPYQSPNADFLSSLLAFDDSHWYQINNWDRIYVHDTLFDGASLTEIVLAPPDLEQRIAFEIPLLPGGTEAHFLIHISETTASLNLYFRNQGDFDAIVFLGAVTEYIDVIPPGSAFLIQLSAEELTAGVRLIIMGEGHFGLRKTHTPLPS